VTRQPSTRGHPPPASPGRGSARVRGQARSAAAAAVLAAACVAWSAIPLADIGGLGDAICVAAIACAALAAVRLIIGSPADQARSLLPAGVRLLLTLADAIRVLPWAEGVVVAVLLLESRHPSRPWHTGLLGVALLGYLFATHLAESGARPAVLRPQLPVIAAGIGLLALAVGAAALPRAGTGPAAVWLIALAAIAVIVIGGLSLPVP
jgi:hypothetical protein